MIDRLPAPIRRYVRPVVDLFKKIQQDRLGGLAAEMAYFLLFAFFPLLIVLFVLLSYTQVDFQSLANFLYQMLPHDIADLVLAIVKEVTANKNLALLSIGVLTAFWAALKGARALVLGVNIAYNSLRSSNFLRTYLVAIVATLGIPLIVVITLTFQVAGQTITNFLADYLPRADVLIWTLKTLGNVLPLVATGLYFLIFYRLAPNVKVRFRDVIFGTVFATLAWYVASFGFSIYINSFANFSKFYGSIGSVIILMLWLYLTSMVILIGAQINAAVARFRHALPVDRKSP
ncbi:MAG: YihY/virulence factor BrkB family protein [Bacillota bacterium]|nr:YihY/virulence factor BrkB family protein [Bacillota bacterium]